MTSGLIKIFERVLKEFIQSHLDVNDLLSNFQHGFRANRSCLSQLLIFNNNLLKILEDGDNCDVIYLNISKAFDCVDIGVPGHRLKQMGIKGLIGTWILEFLTNRKQAVFANNYLSEFTDVLSGVPQGTVLGPILFLILIQSLDELQLDSIMASFADDTKILNRIQSEADVLKMQDSLDKLYV